MFLILKCTIGVIHQHDPVLGVGFAVYVYVDCSRLNWAFLSAVCKYMTAYICLINFMMLLQNLF